MTNNNYNIINYIQSIQEMKLVLINSIISNYKPCKKYEINSEVSDYLYYIEDEPFYISPSFSDVKTDKRISSANPKILLFSAPGATGKSSLAKYLSYKFNGIYWNLSRIKLGTNSFDGTILKAVGASSYSKFIDDLNCSNVLLIIDAFDEAEVVSGRKMISNFIADINNCITKSNNNASIILLARTETAQFLASYCAENKISLQHYEIGFFFDSQAVEFVEKSIVDKDEVIKQVDKDCIDKYFNIIKTNITSKDSKSFLGYAPVLEAISRHIKTCNNKIKMINTLSSQTNCVDIIIKIMDDLLTREQEEKVVVAFKNKSQEKHPEFNRWNELYSKEEQLVRLINYIVFKDTKYINYKIDFLPPQLVDEYQELLDTFLPQHPFVRNDLGIANSSEKMIGFTGPAFRDYTLAMIILNKVHCELVNMYFDESKSDFCFPSQIFFDCYINKTRGVVYSEHLSHIYDSYRAKTTVMESPFLQCSEVDKGYDDISEGIVVLGMASAEKSFLREDTELDLIFNSDALVFDNLSNISLDVPGYKVQIGRNGKDSSIYNSSIVCRQILWNSENISIESYAPEGCLIVSNETTLGEKLTFEIVSDNELKVMIPNISSYYRLIPYKYSLNDASDSDITKFIHSMRCIMMEFRTHKKDTLAKDAERIDNVTIGNNVYKMGVLKYLKDREIIYKEHHLYKVDTKMMQEVGISYAALSRMRIDQLSNVFNDFCTWNKNS